MGGAELLCDTMHVKEIVTSKVRFRSPTYRRVVNDLPRQGESLNTVSRGDSVGNWSVLHPESDEAFPQADDSAVVLTGECGTGKTHLATALCVAACRQRRRVRFTTATGLVNEFVEARQENRVGRLLARWFRYELVAIDEVGYVPLADIGAEFLYQVVSERAERAALIITTNLAFSEWTQVFANARLCKAMVDRVTDRAHIIDTGKESYRFRRTMASRKRKTQSAGRGKNHD